MKNFDEMELTGDRKKENKEMRYLESICNFTLPLK